MKLILAYSGGPINHCWLLVKFEMLQILVKFSYKDVLMPWIGLFSAQRTWTNSVVLSLDIFCIDACERSSQTPWINSEVRN